MDNRPIGIFDSGVGGLTVLNEFEDNLPLENYIYLGDTLNFPYGNKTKDEIIKISMKNTEKLMNKNIKLLIIACGTATSQAMEVLKKNFEIPIIGVIEPTVKYIKRLKISKIGIMATEGTIRSKAWDINIKKEISNIKIVNKACPLLANLAEENEIISKRSINAINNYLIPFREENIENIILGCTHYPLFEDIIKNEYEKKLNLINIAVPLVSSVTEFLAKRNMFNNSKKQNTKIFITKKDTAFENNAKNILKSTKNLDITVFN